MRERGRCTACGCEMSSAGALAGRCPRCLLQLAGAPATSRSRPADRAERRRFGEYLLLRRLGVGPLGVVHEVLQESSGRRLALKRWGAVAASPDTVPAGRLPWAAGALRHPGVVTIQAYGQREETAWVAMQLLPEGSLRQRFDRADSQQGLPLADVSSWFAGVAATLAEVHREGLVHGGIKPENLLFTDDGRRLLLSDFAPANAAAIDALLPLGGAAIPLAPEQTRGAPACAATDIYSLTVCLAEALARRIPPALRNVLQAALHEDPALRPTAAELGRALCGAS